MPTTTRTLSVLASLVALAGTSLALASNPAEMVVPIGPHAGATNLAVVPGHPTWTFNNFSNLYRSSGDRWITAASITSAAGDITGATDQLVVTGNGAAISVAAQEGVTVVGDAGELLNLSGLANPQINETGQWAIAFTPAGAGSTGLVVWWNGSAYHTIVRAGEPATALGPGVVFGNTFASAGIQNDGTVSFINAGISDAEHGTTKAAFESVSTLVARNNLTVPGGQLGGGDAVLTDMDSAASSVGLQVTPDGAHTLLLGNLSGGTTRVVLRDGDVAMQQGMTLPGTNDLVATITAMWLEANGDWFVRGTAGPAAGPATGFIARNGQVIARIGQPIAPGTGEVWAGFIDFKGNNAGDYVVTGTTSAPSTSNNVAVINGRRVFSRAGDPVDLNNDGQLNDGLYVHSYRDRCFLGNDGYFYVGARLKTAPDTTSSLGANVSIIRIRTVGPCNAADVAGLGGALGGDGQLTADDIVAYLAAFFGGNLAVADVASLGGASTPDGQLTADDVIGFLGAFFAGCP